MRKKINWYSLTVIIILVSVGILLFLTRNENSEGAIFARPLIIAFSIGFLIVLYAFKRVFDANNGRNTKKLKKAATISGIIGAIVSLLVSRDLPLLLCTVPLFVLIGVALYRFWTKITNDELTNLQGNGQATKLNHVKVAIISGIIGIIVTLVVSESITLGLLLSLLTTPIFVIIGVKLYRTINERLVE